MLFEAMKKGRITLEQIIEKLSRNPAAIFGVPLDKGTHVQVRRPLTCH